MLEFGTNSYSSSEPNCKLTLHFERVQQTNHICVNGEARASISRTRYLCCVHQRNLSVD